ncbi:MAG: ABC transporter ATP-binding protein [Verrucomicrobiota bacterium]|nr:ABC transporter ATP-binding protein [Verrucomicrobiota bacterium]
MRGCITCSLTPGSRRCRRRNWDRRNFDRSVNKPTAQLGVVGLCRWALRYAFRRWLPLVAVLATMLLNVGLNVLKPWPMVFLIAVLRAQLLGEAMPAWASRLVEFLPGAPTLKHFIGWSVAATVVIFLLSWLVGLANAFANVSLGQRMVYDLAADLFTKLQQLSLRFHASRSVGDNLRRVTADSACISLIVKDALLPVVSSLVTLVVIFGILWRIDATLTLIALAVAPYMLLIFYLYAQPMLRLSYVEQETESRIYEVAEQTLSAIPAVQAFCREELNDRRFQQTTGASLAATLTLTRVQLRFKVLMGLATAVGTAGIYWLGARHALAGNTLMDPVATIVLFLSYLGSLYDPLANVMYTSATIQTAAGSVRRVREVLETEREISDKPGATRLPALRGRVEIEDVTFGYEPDRPILRNIRLAVEPGETVALVGPTGAGKSTLVSLVPRFFDPWQGSVRVDGHDVRDAQLKSLRGQIAIVLQEPFLFPLSVAENIAYGHPQATRAEIEAAARAASAHDFIQRLPQGYQTVVGERGATLSGGERQRLSIARALLKNAPILILDEPTSALDAESEAAFLQALDRLAQGRSTLVIAHRLSTARRANRIIVLENGGIAESGTHEELLRRGGRYAKFHRIQFAGTGD